MLKLRLRNQSQASGVHEVWLVEPRLVIGSAKECQLVLTEEGLKKQHVVIDITGEALRLRALGAGIEINGRPINEGEACELSVGDKLCIGRVSMDVVDPKSERREANRPGADANAPSARKEDWALKANHPALSERVYPLKSQTVVGRSSECDIVLAAAHLSRQHARLFVDQGSLYVKDLGSSNGTFLNGVRVEESRVRRGDELAFDSLSFGVMGPSETVDRTLLREAVNPTIARPVRSAAQKPEKPGTTPELQRSRASAAAPIRTEPEEKEERSSSSVTLIVIAVLAVAGFAVAKTMGLV